MTDLHSGMYGGAAPNPLEALSRMICKLKDEAGKVLIPGFYDRVEKPAADELKAWKSLPFDEEAFAELKDRELGKRVIFTDRAEWSTS